MQIFMGFDVMCIKHVVDIVSNELQAVISRSDDKCITRLVGEMTTFLASWPFSELACWWVDVLLITHCIASCSMLMLKGGMCFMHAGLSRECWVISIPILHWRRRRSSEARQPTSRKQCGEHRTVSRSAMLNSSLWRASSCVLIHSRSCSRFVTVM